MRNFFLLFILVISSHVQAAGKQKPHWFGLERGLMDGFAVHFAPEGFDVGFSYGIMPTLTQSINTQWSGSSWVSTEAKSEFTQVALRVGAYTNYYGTDSMYFNIFAGQMNVKQKRTGGGLPDRSAEAKASFVAGGLGYHWFWDNFNLRLGFALGKINYPMGSFKDASGAVVETDELFELAAMKVAGGLDLAIGWAF